MSNFFLILSFSESNKNRVRGQILKTVVLYFPSCSNPFDNVPLVEKIWPSLHEDILLYFEGKEVVFKRCRQYLPSLPSLSLTANREKWKKKKDEKYFLKNPKLSIVKGLWKNTAHSSLFHNNSLINCFSFFFKSSFENFVPGCIADPDYCSHWSGYQKSRLCLSQFFAKNIEKFDTDQGGNSCE